MPSPAMVVACIALAIALSGASYAAIVLPKNSVGTKQIRNNAVKSTKIAPNQVKGADVDEATLGQVPSAAKAATAATAANATNADSLDTLDATAFATSGRTANGSDWDNNTCAETDVTSMEVTVAKPSRVLAFAQLRFIKDSPSVQQEARMSIQLVSGSSTVASSAITSPDANVAVSEMALSAVLNSPTTGEPFIAAPGTYTLKQHIEVYYNCPFATHVRNARLTYVLLGSG